MLSEEKKELFIKLWNSGLKEEEIARIIGIRVNMVPIYARVLGLPPRTRRAPPNKKLSDEDIQLMKEMWFDGATIQEIADYFNVHPTTVLQYLHAMGLKRRTKTKCPDIPKEELEELCRRGLTDSEIAGIYGTSKNCIMRIRQKYGINKRTLIRQKTAERLRKIVETIAEILNDQGYTTTRELRERYGIRIDKRVLQQLENSIEGFRWFRLTYTSSAKYTVFPISFSNLTIIYLEGFEDKVTTFLLKNLANKEVPRKVVRMILKMNNVSEALLERI